MRRERERADLLETRALPCHRAGEGGRSRGRRRAALEGTRSASQCRETFRRGPRIGGDVVRRGGRRSRYHREGRNKSDRSRGNRSALKETLETLKAARANLAEAAHSLRAYADQIEGDPARLEEIDNRLQELTRLKRKYGGSIDEALRTLEKSRAEIAELENVEISKLKAETDCRRLSTICCRRRES